MERVAEKKRSISRFTRRLFISAKYQNAASHRRFGNRYRSSEHPDINERKREIHTRRGRTLKTVNRRDEQSRCFICGVQSNVPRQLHTGVICCRVMILQLSPYRPRRDDGMLGFSRTIHPSTPVLRRSQEILGATVVAVRGEEVSPHIAHTISLSSARR